MPSSLSLRGHGSAHSPPALPVLQQRAVSRRRKAAPALVCWSAALLLLVAGLVFLYGHSTSTTGLVESARRQLNAESQSEYCGPL